MLKKNEIESILWFVFSLSSPDCQQGLSVHNRPVCMSVAEFVSTRQSQVQLKETSLPSDLYRMLKMHLFGA